MDVQTTFHKMEPRTLGGAVRFYCHHEHTGTHSAGTDTIAALGVLIAQLDKYGDKLPHSVKELPDLTTYHRNVDLSGRIVLDDSNVPVFNLSKHKGCSVEEVFRQEPDYLSWLMQTDFS